MLNAPDRRAQDRNSDVVDDQIDKAGPEENFRAEQDLRRLDARDMGDDGQGSEEHEALRCVSRSAIRAAGKRAGCGKVVAISHRELHTRGVATPWRESDWQQAERPT